MAAHEFAGSEILGAFNPLFAPKSIAIVGASATSVSAGNRFIRALKASKYDGQIVPVHPTAREIEGIPTISELGFAAQTIDYAYLTLPARQAEQVLSNVRGSLRFAQVMASGNIGADQEWEQRLQGLARKGGFRLIGPNCMGTHSPRGRYTFMEDVAVELGQIGIACQSGGLGMDVLRRGQNLGLRFSGLVTLGNSIDVQPSDLFEFYLNDPCTKVIGLYIEDVKDGRRFQALARQNAGRKPVVILIGGLTRSGRRAAASHTGAMGGAAEAWHALAQQTGLILTRSLDEFLDSLQLCLWLVPSRVPEAADITLFGNGGGTSVLATDALDRAGFRLAQPTPKALKEYEEVQLPPGASLQNPIDVPASVLRVEAGRIARKILEINRSSTKPYATIVHLNLAVIAGYRHVPEFLENLMASVLAAQTEPESLQHDLLVLRSDGSAEVDAWRRKFREIAGRRGMPTFDEIQPAIQALSAFNRYERFLQRERLAPG